MPREWFFILFPFIFFSFANAACTSGCPSGGIWGPWSTSATCPDTCGACTNLTYTRTCLSTQINSSCTCSGSNTISMPCATQACNYPRANGSMTTCCIGSPMVINNWYHCGPLASTNTLTCCPDGGYWSAWSSWTKQADKIQWTRTRTCLGGDLNCPCDGDTVDTIYTCPCTPVLTIQNTTACPAANGKQPFTVRTPYFLASRCFASIIFEASNFRQNFFSFNGTNYLTTIGWIDSTGTCQARDVSIGGNGTAGTFYKINFPCDLSTMRFGGMLGGVNMVDLAEIAQFY